MASLVDSAGMSLLELNLPSYGGLLLTVTYYMRSATICVIPDGSNTLTCTTVTDVPSQSAIAGLYTQQFVMAGRAIEGLVATATALSCLTTLAIFLLAFTSATGKSVCEALRSLRYDEVGFQRHAALSS